MKLPLVILLSCLTISPVLATDVDYSSLSNEKLEAKCNSKDGKACSELGINLSFFNYLAK